ncbi:hypothetical protein JTE90_025495 [Oedothorax gibbosus]|uniref:Uncharacterized protein n=1 Tax=Oedothorax gibbosus TaxID=931172 RepID=A0AAV6UYY2_9ARAC|nr:hypothetical protein JTE90_025495 [Oedothorax gibbosus]
MFTTIQNKSIFPSAVIEPVKSTTMTSPLSPQQKAYAITTGEFSGARVTNNPYRGTSGPTPFSEWGPEHREHILCVSAATGVTDRIESRDQASSSTSISKLRRIICSRLVETASVNRQGHRKPDSEDTSGIADATTPFLIKVQTSEKGLRSEDGGLTER